MATDSSASARAECYLLSYQGHGRARYELSDDGSGTTYLFLTHLDEDTERFHTLMAHTHPTIQLLDMREATVTA